MKIINFFNRSLFLFLASAFLVGCASSKQLNYLQDMTNMSQIQIENKFEAVIGINDELTINVTCSDEELAKPFNWHRVNNGSGNGDYGRLTYLVDVNGNIDFPVLGRIHVAGLTRLKLQEQLVQMLKDGHYIDDPYVMVRFYNFKIFFLGPDSGKSITVSNERCTFLEALALFGGLETLTNRAKLGVLREVDGKMTMRYLDPRSSKVFNDPYFMLKQNDIIITEHHGTSYFLKEWSIVSSFLSIISVLTSLATLVIVLFKK